jgi:hypothetical protein
MRTLSRRNLIKGSVAAGLAGATSGCDWPWTPHPLQVNFICSGMLAYYIEPGGKELRILVPHPDHGGKTFHLIRFGGIGGEPLPRGDYRLPLGPNQGSGTSLLPDATKHVVFARDAQGNPPLDLNPSRIYASIRVPIPQSLDPTRVVRKLGGDNRDFFSGDDADYFKIKPSMFPGVYVFRYNSVTGPVSLQGTGDQKPITLAPRSGILNVHLYCERAYDTPLEDHVELFNAMFFRHGTTQQLNLKHSKDDAEGDLNCWEEDYVPAGLSRPDIESLYELGINSKGPKQLLGRCPKITDIAGCVDGWIDGGN